MSFNRPDQLLKLQESFDICIIGGGATGAGVALDATLRGYKVLLIEKGDFASQTSSKSTKLVHGGVRYLEQAVRNLDWHQFKMVYKALHERKTLLKNAPHLAHPLGLLTPCYTRWERWYYRVGMWLYDKISGSTNLKPSRGLSKNEIQAEFPSIESHHLRGGVLYYDGQLNDARYALAILKEAERLGACILNYARLDSFELGHKSLKIKKVIFSDLCSGVSYTIPIKAVVNATGPFTDSVRVLANPRLKPRMKVSRGAHIVLPAEFWTGETALLIPKTDDGRVIFVIPWRGSVLVGTTDDPDTLSENPIILEAEREYLISYFNRYSAKKASLGDISATFVGQRPLLQVQLDSAMNTDTKSLVRDHEVEVDGRSKLVSIMGGKWTTYRVMASDTLNELEKEVLRVPVSPCLTEDHSLEPANAVSLPSGVPEDIAAHLTELYGPAAGEVYANGAERLLVGAPYLVGELDYLKKEEMAVTWDDVLARRWGISLRNEALAEKLQAIKKEAFAS
ncbi:FAD-dependent oxidoreductase [Aquirufa sp. HETE-83D]|uniref:Glycerol-3-phosphate dehydrogenase n=1 Tax=Aquirufa esocilacus TaxID=3096513 RepID=A0ABW6DEE6_9BACT